MASCVVTKDPDNTWYTWIDWSDWFDDQIAEIGGTFTVTASVWFPDSAISEEGTKLDDTTKIMYFFGSGGVAGTKYDILNRISYTSTTLGSQVFTEDRTIQIRIKEK
jgi:hypothetical protein